MNNKKKNTTTGTIPGTGELKRTRVLGAHAMNAPQTKQVSKVTNASTSKQTSSKHPIKKSKAEWEPKKADGCNAHNNSKYNPEEHENFISKSTELKQYGSRKEINETVRPIKSMSHNSIIACTKKSKSNFQKNDTVEKISNISLPNSATKDVISTSIAATEEIKFSNTEGSSYENRKLHFKRQAIILMKSLFPDNNTTHTSEGENYISEPEQKDTEDKETQTISQNYKVELPKPELQSLITTESSHIIETAIPLNGTTLKLSIQIPKENSQLEFQQQLHDVQSDLADIKVLLKDMQINAQNHKDLERNLGKLEKLNNELECVNQPEVESVEVGNIVDETSKINNRNFNATTSNINNANKTIQGNGKQIGNGMDKKRQEKEKNDTTVSIAKEKKNTATVEITGKKRKTSVTENTVVTKLQEKYPANKVFDQREKLAKESAARKVIIDDEHLKGAVGGTQESYQKCSVLNNKLSDLVITGTEEKKDIPTVQITKKENRDAKTFSNTDEESKDNATIGFKEKTKEHSVKKENVAKINVAEKQKENFANIIGSKKEKEERNAKRREVIEEEEMEGAVGYLKQDDKASIILNNALDGMVFIKGGNVIYFSKKPNNKNKSKIDQFEHKHRTVHQSSKDIWQIKQDKSQKCVSEVNKANRMRFILSNFVDTFNFDKITFRATKQRKNKYDSILPKKQMEQNNQIHKEVVKVIGDHTNKEMKRIKDLEKKKKFDQYYNGRLLYYVNFLNHDDDDDEDDETIRSIKPPTSLLRPCKPAQETQRTPVEIKSLFLQNESTNLERNKKNEENKSKKKKESSLIKHLLED